MLAPNYAIDAKTFLKHFSDCLFYFCSTCAYYGHDIRENMFLPRIVNIWNSLPDFVVNVDSAY